MLARLRDQNALFLGACPGFPHVAVMADLGESAETLAEHDRAQHCLDRLCAQSDPALLVHFSPATVAKPRPQVLAEPRLTLVNSKWE